MFLHGVKSLYLYFVVLNTCKVRLFFLFDQNFFRKALFCSILTSSIKFDACGAPANHSVKGLAFPRMAKVVSRRVWHFRAWRKSFPEGFGISALGESHFPKGLAFPRSVKVISRRVWHFRARRKSFSEGFGISALGEKIKKIRETIKQNSINKRISENKRKKYQHK